MFITKDSLNKCILCFHYSYLQFVRHPTPSFEGFWGASSPLACNVIGIRIVCSMCSAVVSEKKKAYTTYAPVTSTPAQYSKPLKLLIDPLTNS